MAKSKNHTNHNQNRKAHRNGIKKPKHERYSSLRGVDQKFLRNQRFAKRFATRPKIQSQIDKLRHRKQEKLVRQAMVRICRERRLAFKNRAVQLKKAAEQKKALLDEALKQGKTKEQFLKELREKNQALHKQIHDKRHAEVAKAKEEKRKFKKQVKKSTRPGKKERILAKNPELAAKAKAEGESGKQTTIVPLSKKAKKKLRKEASKNRKYAEKINQIALKRIKGFKLKSKRQRELTQRKKSAASKLRSLAKAQLREQYLTSLKDRRHLVNRSKLVKKAIAKAQKAKAAAGTEKPKRKTTVKKDKKKKAVAAPSKVAKVAKSAKAAKPAKPATAVAATKKAAPARKTVKVSAHLRRVLLAEIKKEQKKVLADRKAKKAAAKKNPEAKKAEPSVQK